MIMVEEAGVAEARRAWHPSGSRRVARAPGYLTLSPDHFERIYRWLARTLHLAKLLIR
jgi:hypothetical protein